MDSFERWDLNEGSKERRSGQIVETKTGIIGRTYGHEELINGKVRVYSGNCKLLCDPKTLKITGFID